jgi:hypothetical protein
MKFPALTHATLVRIQPLLDELKAIGDGDFVRTGGILRQIEYHCQAPVEMAGFDQTENRLIFNGMDLN